MTTLVKSIADELEEWCGNPRATCEKAAELAVEKVCEWLGSDEVRAAVFQQTNLHTTRPEVNYLVERLVVMAKGMG